MVIELALIMLAQGDRVRHFRGFVLSERTAVAVACPIYREMLGPDYLSHFNSLKAKYYRGYWILRVGELYNPTGEYFSVEPYSMAINSQTCEISLFGYDHVVTPRMKSLPKIQFMTNAKPRLRGKR
jgi:hypothetical protein